MSQAVDTLLAEFEAAARTVQQAEDALRNKMAADVAPLERRRAFAFRRTNLVRTLAVAALAADTEEIAAAAQRAAVREELSWRFESDAHRAILDRLQPVGRVVWQCARDVEESTPPAVHAELEAFETWFEAAHGKSFYELFDQYVPEMPVVEF